MLNVRNLPARNLVRVKKSYSGALPQPPFLCLLISPTYSGKTVWILNLLAEKRFKFADQFKVVIISPTYGMNPVWDNIEIDKKYMMKTFDEEKLAKILAHQLFLKEKYQKKKSKKHLKPLLLIIDDNAAEEAMRSKAMDTLAIRSRHYHVGGIIITTQAYKLASPVVRAQASNIILFQNLSRGQLHDIADENSIRGLSFKNFESMFLKATSDDYAFMHIRRRDKDNPYMSNFTHRIDPDTFDITPLTLPAPKQRKDPKPMPTKLNVKRRRTREIFRETDPKTGQVIDSDSSDYSN